MRTLSLAVLALFVMAGNVVAQTQVEQRAILGSFERAIAAYAAQVDCTGEHVPPASSSEAVIFTLPVSIVFRQLISTALDEPHIPAMSAPRRPPERQLMTYDTLPLADSASLPDLVTDALPVLPPALEYRLLGHDLVIRETPCNLVVAVLRDAIRYTTTTTQHR